MSLFKSKITVVTHDGDFHPDDVFACATLLLWAEKSGKKLEIIRSREKEATEKADIVVDVGGGYNPEKNKFDHHQKGGAGIRDNGIPYASFGLVWKKYGEIICGNKEVADRIEEKLVMPVDARDNGIALSTNLRENASEYLLHNALKAFRPTWKDDVGLFYQKFVEAANIARFVLLAEIHTEEDFIEGEAIVLEEIKKQNNPEILILDEPLPWESIVPKVENIKFIICPDSNRINFCAEAGRDDLENYNSDRAEFPRDWRGLRDEDLAKISGIKDAVFCINGGWFAVAKTKEGAIEMARKALQIAQK